MYLFMSDENQLHTYYIYTSSRCFNVFFDPKNLGFDTKMNALSLLQVMIFHILDQLAAILKYANYVPFHSKYFLEF